MFGQIANQSNVGDPVSFKYLVFNHVPKCAGTSIRHMIYQACLNSKLAGCPLYIPPYTHENICLQERPESVDIISKNSRVFMDHSYAYFFEDYFNLDVSNTYRIINIRHPVDRFISHMLFFDKLHPECCSYKDLVTKTSQYGFILINYLTLTRYATQDLDIETRYKIAETELSKYDWVFKQEDLVTSISEFNQNNPFDLTLEEVSLNKSEHENIEISRRRLSDIEKLLKLEIDLLRDYYPPSDSYSKRLRK